MSGNREEDAYKEYCRSLDEALARSENEFEKKITYLAAGALGLSFVFISDIVGFHQSRCACILFLGWVLLITCLIMNLVSHLNSKSHIVKTREECDEKYNRGENFVPDPQKIAERNQAISRINDLTTIFFIAGTILILVYVGINLFEI